MKGFFLFLGIILVITTDAQETQKKEKQKRISIGVNFSPDYDFRTLKNNDGSSSSDFVIKSRNDIETAKFGYATGLSVNVRFSKILAFETGILYSNKGYRTGEIDLYYPLPDPSSPTQYKSLYSFHYLDIPLKLNVTTGKGKVKLIASAGLAANFLIKESETVTQIYSNGDSKKEKQSSTSDYNEFNISPLISLGLEYRLKNSFSIRAEPTFRYGVLKIIDQPVTEYLWNAGLNIGIYYDL